MNEPKFTIGQQVFYYEKIDYGFSIKKSIVTTIEVEIHLDEEDDYFNDFLPENTSYTIYYTLCPSSINTFTEDSLFASAQDAFNSIIKL